MTEHPLKNIRQRAEEILRGKPVNVDTMRPQEIERILHELQVHEIELQLQNEELRATQYDLEVSRQKYADLYDYAPVGYLIIDRNDQIEGANFTVTAMLDTARERLFQQRFGELVIPAHRHIYAAHRERLLTMRSDQRDELQLLKGNGEMIYAQLDSTLMRAQEEGEPARFHMVITDITQRKQAEMAMLEQRVFAESLSKISFVLNNTLDLDEVLSLILDNINHVVRHDVAEVLLFGDGYATVVGSKGYSTRDLQDSINEMRLSIARTENLSQIVHTGRPVILQDVNVAPGWKKILIRESMRAYLGVPIHLKDRVIGCLNVFNHTAGFYDEVHGKRLQAFAGQTATAIKNAQLYKDAQEVAVLQERQRLARDLHDAVSQTLFSASMIAEALPRLNERNPDAVSAHLEKLLKLTRGAMAEMRALLLELRPDTMERYTLSELLEQLVAAVLGRKQIAIHMHLSSEPVLSPDVKEGIYRVAQETLNNVIKHSQATEVTIHLENSDHGLTMTIQDNGRGFDARRVTSGIGLYSMSERAQAINAELNVRSAPGQGTAVILVCSEMH